MVSSRSCLQRPRVKQPVAVDVVQGTHRLLLIHTLFNQFIMEKLQDKPHDTIPVNSSCSLQPQQGTSQLALFPEPQLSLVLLPTPGWCWPSNVRPGAQAFHRHAKRIVPLRCGWLRMSLHGL